MRLTTILAAITLAFPAFAQEVKEQPKDDDKPAFPLEEFYAERKPWGRSFLKDFHFSLSTGFGNTFFRHELSGFGVAQPTGYDTRIYSMANGAEYTNWLNTVVGAAPLSVPYIKIEDTEKIGFKGSGFNIPLKATVHYEFQGKYRLGAGYSYEMMIIGRMRPITHQDQLTGFQPSLNKGIMKKYFGMLGFSFYRIGTFLFTGDANVGGFNPGNNFTAGLIQKGVYVNAGVTIEQEFSENLQIFARPSFEIKNYTMSMVGSGAAGIPDGAIVHNFNAFYLNFGITYSLPALPKCYNKDCQAQLNHAHGDREYRSRMHKFWKKQSPMYGENYPKLFKYKGQNKKKLNPY